MLQWHYNTRKGNMKIHHHGDIPIQRVDSLPEGVKLQLVPRDHLGRAIIAEGEATGHAHAIVATMEDVSIFRIEGAADTGERFLKIEKEVEIQHEEHGRFTLSPGIYHSWIAREFDPVEGARRVVD